MLSGLIASPVFFVKGLLRKTSPNATPPDHYCYGTRIMASGTVGHSYQQKPDSGTHQFLDTIAKQQHSAKSSHPERSADTAGNSNSLITTESPACAELSALSGSVDREDHSGTLSRPQILDHSAVRGPLPSMNVPSAIIKHRSLGTQKSLRPPLLKEIFPGRPRQLEIRPANPRLSSRHHPAKEITYIIESSLHFPV